MTDIEIDASELDALVRDLLLEPAKVLIEAHAVVTKGALNVKKDWRASATRTAGRHGRLYPLSITYDTTLSGAGPEAEIGPDAGSPQGGMGRGFEFGSVNQPPHLDGTRAADAEEPRFGLAAQALVERLLSR